MDMLELSFEGRSPRVLHVEGELDVSTADKLRVALADGLSGDSTLVVDMAGVTFVDASGLRVILEAADQLNGHGPLTIANAALVERLLGFVGLSGIPSIVLRHGD